MKMLDLFTGYGGFTLAADKQNIETIAFCEIDKYASATLKHNWKGIKNYGDITKTDFTKYKGQIDIITGGSPCQSFSIAGKRAGMFGKSGIINHYFRAIEEVKPTYFIWENVKGVYSIDRGWTYANILCEMDRLGYDIWWQTLNATQFGIPQNRERVFVTGVRRGSGGKILSQPKSIRQDYGICEQSTNTLTARYGTSLGSGSYIVEGKQYENEIVVYGSTQKNSSVRTDGVVPTLTSAMGQGGGHTPMNAIPVLTPDREEKRQNGRRFKTNGEPAYTLTAQDKHGIFDGSRIRKLTPLECERLMGLPDNHTKYGIIDDVEVLISDSQRYKMCGNGVVPKCVEYILSMLETNL